MVIRMLEKYDGRVGCGGAYEPSRSRDPWRCESCNTTGSVCFNNYMCYVRDFYHTTCSVDYERKTFYRHGISLEPRSWKIK